MINIKEFLQLNFDQILQVDGAVWKKKLRRVIFSSIIYQILTFISLAIEKSTK